MSLFIYGDEEEDGKEGRVENDRFAMKNLHLGRKV